MLLLSPNLAFHGLSQQPVPGKPPENSLARGESLIRSGKVDEAIAWLVEVRQKEPDLPGLEAKLGKAYYRKRDFRQAISHLRSALKKNPQDREAEQLLGLCLYSVGQLEQAIPLLESIQSRLPQAEFDGLYLLGVCYLRTQQLQRARAVFAQMFAAPPDSATAYLLFAQMMVRQHLEDQAIPELEKAISLDPRLPMVHFLLGEIYLYKLNPQRALDEFKKELDMSSTLWLVYWRLGDAYARLERYEEAEKSLKQAIWLNETFTGPYILLGQVELKKGDVELAAEFLDRALKLDPRNYLAHYSIAKAYQQMGRTEDATRHFELSRSLRGEKKNAEELAFKELIP